MRKHVTYSSALELLVQSTEEPECVHRCYSAADLEHDAQTQPSFGHGVGEVEDDLTNLHRTCAASERLDMQVITQACSVDLIEAPLHWLLLPAELISDC